MKEATAELNGVVAVVLAIGVLIAFFYYTLWPLIRTNFQYNSQCSKAICEPCHPDVNGEKNCDYVVCHPKNDPTNTFECVYKG